MIQDNNNKSTVREDGKKSDEWTLVRPGDKCLINDNGISLYGVCRYIIRLSNGKTLMVMSGFSGEDLGIFNACYVRLSNPVSREPHITSLDTALLHFEPRGMTTNHSFFL